MLFDYSRAFFRFCRRLILLSFIAEPYKIPSVDDPNLLIVISLVTVAYACDCDHNRKFVVWASPCVRRVGCKPPHDPQTMDRRHRMPCTADSGHTLTINDRL